MSEWKKVKFSVCPKCQRNCSVAGAKSADGDWEPIGSAKKIEGTKGKYDVECPGCGVHFTADIYQTIPCYEEIR